jgi:hypothetical protein
MKGRKDMHRIATTAALLLLCAGPALAADDVMANAYGNTVVSTGGPIESHTHYRADHTFDMTASAGGQTFSGKGTWAIDGTGQLCRTFETPPPGTPNPLCLPIAAHKVGDSWTVSFGGQTRTATLVAGIQ